MTIDFEEIQLKAVKHFSTTPKIHIQMIYTLYQFGTTHKSMKMSIKVSQSPKVH